MKGYKRSLKNFMKNTYLSKVRYFFLVPRLRVNKITIELVWLGLNLLHYRQGDEPIFLAYAGKKRMHGYPEPYRPIGFPGGTLADFVPEGMYCYTYKDDEYIVCPFWDSDLERPKQSNGFCHLMNTGDWTGRVDLLWDQCKECGINDSYSEEED